MLNYIWWFPFYTLRSAYYKISSDFLKRAWGLNLLKCAWRQYRRRHFCKNLLMHVYFFICSSWKKIGIPTLVKMQTIFTGENDHIYEEVYLLIPMESSGNNAFKLLYAHYINCWTGGSCLTVHTDTYILCSTGKKVKFCTEWFVTSP